MFNGNIKKNIPLIKELGYDGVDLFIIDPKEEISTEAVKLLNKYQLGIGVIMPAALAKMGYSLSSKDIDTCTITIKKMQEIITFASQHGANISLGLIRGSFTKNDTRADLLKRFAISCEKLIPFAQKHKVKLLIEPINRYEINNLNSSLEAYEFINDYQLPLYLMLDSFHMNIEDISIKESIYTCKELIQHFHFVDSNRLAPGMGHTNMKEIFSLLKEINYTGYLCLETLPSSDFIACAQKGIDFFLHTGL